MDAMVDPKSPTATCSLCGKSEGEGVTFSKRQKSKAKKQEPAKCSSCIESAATAAHSSPATATASTPLDLTQSIPKKKRPRLDSDSSNDSDSNNRGPLYDSDSSDSDDNDNHGDDSVQVSLNAIKRSVLGRDLHVETPGKSEQEELDGDLANIRQLLQATPSSPLVAAADKLQSDLQCAICHDLVYPPVSLPCGHSFCQDCLEWWWKTSPTCPTCRESAEALPKINWALKRCVMTLYASHVVHKIQSRRKNYKGENGGQHAQGYQVLSPLEDEFWHSVLTTGDSSSDNHNKMVRVRRSIVLDADDQRMQLALALYEPPKRQSNALSFSLCLLCMEEDEASDGGFPVLLGNAEDEQLICTNESRFQYSLLEMEMTKENGSIAPVARISPQLVELPGIWQVQWDSVLCWFHDEAMLLRIRHEDTGAILELDLALLKTGASGGSFVDREQRDQERRRRQRETRRANAMVMDAMDNTDSEGENLDEYEDDGFLVHEAEGSDVEGQFSGDEEGNDTCCICRDGGDLMICDGGREMDGCGKSFHCGCVDRPSIPEGDWICSDCARSGGIQVQGKRGHEFVFASRSKSASAKGKQEDDDEPAGAANGRSKGAFEDSSDVDSDALGEETRKRKQEEEEPAGAANGRSKGAFDDSSDDDSDARGEETRKRKQEAEDEPAGAANDRSKGAFDDSSDDDSDAPGEETTRNTSTTVPQNGTKRRMHVLEDSDDE